MVFCVLTNQKGGAKIFFDREGRPSRALFNNARKIIIMSYEEKNDEKPVLS